MPSCCRALTFCASLVLAIGATLPAVGGTIRHDRQDSRYTTYGRMFSSVGQVKGTFAGGGTLSGSGVLIAPDLVLTAAHVTENTRSLQFNLPELGASYQAEAVSIHPAWKGDVLSGADLSVFRLDRPVTEVAPAARFRGWWDAARPGAIAGYGISGTGISGYSGGVSSVRRAGTNVIDRRMDGRILLTDFDAPHYLATGANLGDSTPTELEYSIAPGDSGGGLFVWVNRQWTLVGINSFVLSYDGGPNASYGDSSGFTRVRTYQAWLDHAVAGRVRWISMGAASTLLTWEGRATALGVAAVPEPASVGVLLLLASLTGWRRR